LPKRRGVDARFCDHVEEIEERPDIETEPMIGDPAVDGHSDRGDSRLPKEDPGLIWAHRSVQLKFVKNTEDRPLEPCQIACECQAAGTQGQGQVRCNLPRKMEHAPASSVDPVHPNSHSTEELIIGNDMGPASRSPHTDRWRVLAEKQASPLPPSEFVDDATLERLDFQEVDVPQKVDFQRG
jgi:hypothetical protein